MIFGFRDVSMIPKTNIIHFRGHQNTEINSRTIIFKHIMFGNLLFGKSSFWKRWGLENPEYGINI